MSRETLIVDPLTDGVHVPSLDLVDRLNASDLAMHEVRDRSLRLAGARRSFPRPGDHVKVQFSGRGRSEDRVADESA